MRRFARPLLILSALVALLVMIGWLAFVLGSSPVSTACIAHNPNAGPNRLSRTPEPQAHGASTETAVPKPEDPAATNRRNAELALKKLNTGYRAIVDAKSYRRRSTSYLSDGSYTVSVITRLRSDKGDLFHCRSERFLVDGSPDPNFTREEITNETGNWELYTRNGSEEVAFLRTDKRDPTNTVDAHKMMLQFATSSEFPDPSLVTYTVGNAVVGTEVVDSVKFSWGTGTMTTEYRYDKQTGATLGWEVAGPSTRIMEEIELNPEVPESLFTIPGSRIVMPTADPRVAAEHLRLKEGEAQPRSEEP